MDYDRKQFELLFKDSYPHMYRLAYSLVEDGEEARDAVSQVFAQMWRTKPRVADDKVRGYLLAATRNQCMHTLRQRRLRMEMESALQSEEEAQDWRERQEVLDELERVIAENLTEQDRRVLELHYDEGLTYSQAAGRLGISIAAVNKHITKSLSKIRTHWKKRGTA